MSYEGYDQHICIEGHYYTVDAYDDDKACHECGKESAWSNAVDETNFYDDGFIPEEDMAPYLIRAEDPDRPALYRIPSDLDTARMRKYYAPDRGVWLRLTPEHEINLNEFCDQCGGALNLDTGYCKDWHVSKLYYELKWREENGNQ